VNFQLKVVLKIDELIRELHFPKMEASYTLHMASTKELKRSFKETQVPSLKHTRHEKERVPEVEFPLLSKDQSSTLKELGVTKKLFKKCMETVEIKNHETRIGTIFKLDKFPIGISACWDGGPSLDEAKALSVYDVLSFLDYTQINNLKEGMKKELN